MVRVYYRENLGIKALKISTLWIINDIWSCVFCGGSIRQVGVLYGEAIKFVLLRR